MRPSSRRQRRFAQRFRACTEQFFELVAGWKLDAVTVAYEHGYIPVELTVPEEREQHRKMIEERVSRIYPAFNYVVTISKYAVDYIRWPEAFVLYNGADHFAKALAPSRCSSGRGSELSAASTAFRMCLSMNIACLAFV